MGRQKDDMQITVNLWEQENSGLKGQAVAEDNHIAVLDSGKVALFGLSDPHLGERVPFWIETAEGYDQGEAISCPELYERVQQLKKALLVAQIPMTPATGLALAILSLQMVGSEYVQFNAHDFHKGVLALAPVVMWTREPEYFRGLTMAYAPNGDQYETTLDLRRLSSDEQAVPARGEINTK